MKGYIGVTSREWFSFLADEQFVGEINFWRKNTKNFRVLEHGDSFFFLVKNKKGTRTERTIPAMATFERFEVNSVNKAWDRYKQGNGDVSKNQFINRMYEMFKTTEENNEIGCIILSDFKVFANPVVLSELKIDFQNSIVSGKGITAK